MDNEVKRAVSTFLGKNLNQMIFYFIRTKTVPTNAKIERELAQKYGEIAERMTAEEHRMAGRTTLGGEPLCPLEHPSKAGEIVETVYGLMKEEVEAGNVERDGIERVKKRIHEKTMRKLGLNQKR